MTTPPPLKTQVRSAIMTLRKWATMNIIMKIQLSPQMAPKSSNVVVPSVSPPTFPAVPMPSQPTKWTLAPFWALTVARILIKKPMNVASRAKKQTKCLMCRLSSVKTQNTIVGCQRQRSTAPSPVRQNTIRHVAGPFQRITKSSRMH